jgi:hypothetical protein
MEAIEKLAVINEELDQHTMRLSERALQIRTRADNEPDPFRKELLGLVSESLNEQVQTGLDFMRELVTVVADGFAEAGEDAEPGLMPDDAKQILEVLAEHLAMLRAYLPQQTDEAARGILAGKIKKTEAVIDLVDSLTLLDDDAPAGDDDEEDDEEEEDGAGPN